MVQELTRRALDRAVLPGRVAFVLGQCRPGGTESQAQLLVRGLCARGVSVDVFVVEGTASGADFGGAQVVALQPGGRRAGVLGALGTALAGVRLAYALRRHRYDVVHAALARAYVVAPLAAPWRHRPRVVVWRRNLGVHLRPRRGMALVDGIAARLSDVVVANSAAVSRYWVARGHVPQSRMRIIPNALEPWRFDPVPTVADPAVARLVTVGGLRDVKGHDVLLEAASILRARFVPVEVVVVGDGPKGDALRDRAERLGVPLTLPGHVADPREWLAAATVYVHPSHSEGASNAVAEAMAQRCAVVATDVGGTAEMLGPHGVVVPPGDAVALADAVGALLADPDRRASLGGEARERARLLFALDRVVDQHLDIYVEG